MTIWRPRPKPHKFHNRNTQGFSKRTEPTVSKRTGDSVPISYSVGLPQDMVLHRKAPKAWKNTNAFHLVGLPCPQEQTSVYSLSWEGSHDQVPTTPRSSQHLLALRSPQPVGLRRPCFVLRSSSQEKLNSNPAAEGEGLKTETSQQPPQSPRTFYATSTNWCICTESYFCAPNNIFKHAGGGDSMKEICVESFYKRNYCSQKVIPQLFASKKKCFQGWRCSSLVEFLPRMLKALGSIPALEKCQNFHFVLYTREIIGGV